MRIGDIVHYGAFGAFGSPCIPAIVLHVFSEQSIVVHLIGGSQGFAPVPGAPTHQSAMHGYAQSQWHHIEECMQ